MAISFISLFAALRYKAGQQIRILSTRPVYRVGAETRNSMSVRGDELVTHRGRTSTQTTHRVSRVEAD